MADLIVYNIGMLATPTGTTALGGPAMGDVTKINDAYMVVAAGKIVKTGSGSGYKQYSGDKVDAGGGLVIPGLIDAHTHLIYAGSREHEFRRRLNGENYLDILASGGGILETVTQTRAAAFNKLYAPAAAALDKMLLLGVTVVEAKSGYGLDRATELKQLRVVKQLAKDKPQHLVATYLGAYAIPPEYQKNRQDYIDLMKEVLITIKREGLAEFCDVFCEDGIFTYEESREILQFAGELGFRLRIHADEITNSGGSRLAAELKCRFADHLLAATDAEFRAMAAAGVVLTVLPLTSFILGKPFARVRTMIAQNAAVAISTDYNPGSCPSYNLQLAMQTAVMKTQMTPEEALTATTLNPAYGLGLASQKGSIEVGKDADFIIFDCCNLDYFFYRFGENRVKSVYIGGRKLVSDGRIV